jgi:hypothetical protein
MPTTEQEQEQWGLVFPRQLFGGLFQNVGLFFAEAAGPAAQSARSVGILGK